jgi:hypothetical protein
MEINELKVGDRIEMHPASDAWMRGDRYGEVLKVGKVLVTVKLDRSGWKLGYHMRSILRVIE